MRIIAGKYRSRKLSTLEGLSTRPTLDQVKEAIFNSLGGYLVDMNILDVFGGSGALSLEAISRGARHSTILDSNFAAIEIIKKNASSLGVVVLYRLKQLVEGLDILQFSILTLQQLKLLKKMLVVWG